ncbi:MAG TPA: fibronectin type III domain-containing protein [Prolixibacteraceae bacterium]|nr:fibronectin type III domain-containing protein [Prolixibacteraceae bacterium]
MKNFPIIRFAVCFLLATSQAQAQAPLSLAGPDGIFTQFGTVLPDTFIYKLYRTTELPDEKPVFLFSGEKPRSAEELKIRLVNINAKNPVYPLPDDSTLGILFQRIEEKKRIDSFPVAFLIPQNIEAMGLGFYDPEVEPGKKYGYIVNRVDRMGHVLHTFSTSPVSAPGSQPDFGVRFRKSYPAETSIVLDYSYDPVMKPFDFRIFRQAYLQTGFREIFPEELFFSERDSSFYRISDPNIIPGTLYRYVLIPCDILGNPGFCPDTVRVSCTPAPSSLPVFSQLTAVGNSAERAIELKWEQNGGTTVNSISVFRSTRFDGDYSLLTRLPGTVNRFLDRNIRPLQSYTYYLVLHGLSTDYPPSVKVSGILPAVSETTLPPRNITLEQTDEGNKLSWEKPEPNILGYYVYRGIGYGPESRQISPLIPAEAQKGVFLDSVQNIRPGIAYHYEVAAMNESFSIGEKSEPVYSEPITQDLPAPTNFFINRQGNGAFLVWDPMIERSPYISGFHVYRTNKNQTGSNLLPLTAQPLSYDQNTYLDTNLVRGVNYIYTVQSVGTGNSASAHSVPFEFTLPEIKPFPPSGVRLTPTPLGGILYWDSPATENIRAFVVYREKSGDKKAIKMAELPPDTNIWEFEAGEKGMFYYSVGAINQKGEESPRSEEVWHYVPEE